MKMDWINRLKCLAGIHCGWYKSAPHPDEQIPGNSVYASIAQRWCLHCGKSWVYWCSPPFYKHDPDNFGWERAEHYDMTPHQLSTMMRLHDPSFIELVTKSRPEKYTSPRA